MTWNLIRELGIDYFDSPEAEQQQTLCFPTYAAQAKDGTYVIAEEFGAIKQVPFRFECRTIRVDQNATVRFDSRSMGIDDGFGCLMDDDCLAIVRRAHWELLVVSPDGTVIDRLQLHRISKRIPRYVRWTDSGTFLITFFNRSFELDIAEVDRQGRLLWYLPSNEQAIGIPSSVQRLGNDRLLLADPFRHYVSQIDRDGNTLWRYGEPENPSNQLHCVSSPHSATRLPGGPLIVADTRNHRILSIDSDNRSRTLALPDSGLCDPTYAAELASGDYLICDTGNCRVIRIDRQGSIVWQYGDTSIQRRHLSYPRSIQFTHPDRYLVADTGNNRIVEFVGEEVHAGPRIDQQMLFWPRCVRRLAPDAFLIADARNGRIVEVTQSGKALRELRAFHAEASYSLQDPHDVRRLSNSHLLICDSPQNLVVEVDWSGKVHRTIGDTNDVELKDPHSAQQLNDGSVLIADTGNHRLILIDSNGKCIRSIEAIKTQTQQWRLRHPRYAEVDDHGTVVVADTAQNRILGCTLSGEYLWEFSDVPDSPLGYLNQPRWATMVSNTELVVCDHFHHRIVHVRRSV